MAHQLDFSTGAYAIAYTGDTPWHGKGVNLKADQSIETWLKAACLEWKLNKVPVHFLVEDTLRTMKDRFVLVRDDTNEALSIVSGRYHPVQPAEILEFYRDLVGSSGYSLETAGALQGGRKVWALAKTGIEGNVGREGEDTLAAYLLLATSCDKTLATTVAFTSIRVVCQNTLSFAQNDVKSNKRLHLKVPHNHRFNPDTIKAQLNLVNVAWMHFIKQAQQMTQHHLNKQAERDFYIAVLSQGSSSPATDRETKELELVTALATTAPGQNIATANGTVWGAVNAITFYADHARPGADRLNSAWFGAGAVLKEKAWAKALTLIA